jgi:PAS domain S-box-containing protein
MALVLALVATLATLTVRRLFATWQDVVETHLTIQALSELFSTLQDIETGARGYAMAGREEFLEPYQEGSARLDLQLAQLEELIPRMPSGELAAIATLAHSRRAESATLVDLSKREGMEIAAQRVREMRGKNVMDAVRDEIAGVQQRETVRLRERETEVRRLARATLGGMAGLAGVVVVLAGLLYRSATRDLVRRRQEAEARQHAADVIHDLYNRAPCGYHSLDPDGRFLEVNDTELAWLGYTREEMVNRLAFSDLLTPESLQYFRACYPRFKQQGFIHDLEFDVRRKNGSLLSILISATAVYDDNGAFLRSRSSVFDNSERKRLQAERDRVFALVPDLLCVSGFDGVFQRVNEAWHSTLGHSLDDLMKRPFMNFVHPEDRDATAREMGRLLEGREVTNFENRYQHVDGTYRWLSWKCIPDTARRLIYASARDITEQRETRQLILSLNEDLRRYTVRLESTNRELEAFSYSVSHDLRAPLRSIDGFSRVLLEDCAAQLGEEGRAHLQRIIRATGRMADLIDDMTKLARVSRGELRPEPVDLSGLARSVAESLAQREPGRAVQVRVADGLTANADPALLRIVLENLLGNAWKFTGRTPHACIDVGREDGTTPTVFFVRDNGAGFDMAYAGRLFGAFQRLHSDQEFTGTGIGLATVQRIIHRHGGRIWADGQVNQGATFRFTLS